MTVLDKPTADGRIRHYSDTGLMLRQVETGAGPYEDAVDIIPCPYTYEETNEPIETHELTPEELLQAAEAALTEGVNSIG